MSEMNDNPDGNAVPSRSPHAGEAVSGGDAPSDASAPGSDESREERIIRDEFEGLDNDLVDVAKFAENQGDGRGPAPGDERERQVPDGNLTDTADLSVGEYDRSRQGR